MVTKVLKFQIEKARDNLLTLLLISITALGVLYVGYLHDKMIQAVAYLFAMWFCSFFIDLYGLWQTASNDFVVRNPKRETMWFFLCTGLGLIGLLIRFVWVTDWPHLNPLSRLAVLPLIVFFVFPIAMAVIFLVLKYKLPDLGVRFQGLLIALPVIAICAVTSRIVSPESLTWNLVLEEGGGVAGAIFTGFIMAGLSEEFFRFIGQTRLGALLNNFGIAWFITTLIWGLMHAPKWYGEEHNLTEALLGAIRIVPLGLMWGYLTHRTKSILPAVLVHGSNVWGLQNF